MAKAKWLEGSNRELLALLAEALKGETPDLKKAEKIVAELATRTPEEGNLTVTDALANLEAATALVKTAYEAELAAMDNEADNEPAEDPAPAEEKKSKKNKKNKKVEEPAEEAPAETGLGKGKGKKNKNKVQPADDYDKQSAKKLKTTCRERGIKVKKEWEKEDMIKALRADDKE